MLVLGIIFVLGLGFVIYIGRSNVPAGHVKVPYTQFKDPAELVEVLVSESREDLQSASLVMLGVIPGRRLDLEFWKTFLERSKAVELQFQVVVVDSDLPGVLELFPNAVKMDLKKETDRFIEGAKNARAQGLRLVVIVPSIYASQSLAGSPANLIRETSDLAPLSFSLAAFPRGPEEEVKMETPCVMGPNDRNGTGALGCAIVEVARLEYRQQSKPGFYEGMMKRLGARDYLVLLNPK